MDKRAIYAAWLNAGFLPEEADELTYGSKGVKVDAEEVYRSRPARIARRTRQEWIRWLLDRGWTTAEIKREIGAYYAFDTKRSPWDFIRAEYRPPQRKDYRDYREAARRRAGTQVKSLYR